MASNNSDDLDQPGDGRPPGGGHSLNLYISGATGFVGCHVLAEALRRGHTVTAVVRPGSDFRLPDHIPHDRCRTVSVDLRSRTGLADSLAGVDSVVHLAAAKAGDFYSQFAGTVTATENLLAAMDEADVRQLIGISTFSAYDYLNLPAGSLLTESTAVDTHPALRDEYAQTKLLQEELYRQWGGRSGNKLVVLRPGMVYGPDNLWHALLGADFGPRFLRIGSKATLPLTYVDNCAQAIILAAERLDAEPDLVDGETINIVDDDLPTQSEYAELVSARTETPPTVPVPWPLLDVTSRLLKAGNQRLLHGRAKFPGIAVPDRLHARFKPLRYSNAKAKRLLGWQPAYSTVEAVERSVASMERRFFPLDELIPATTGRSDRP